MSIAIASEEAIEFYRKAPRFGMVSDRFGVGWMIDVEAEDTRRRRRP